MAFDFQKSLKALQIRKFGNDLVKSDLLENFSGKTSEGILYISEAMRPVSKTYTDNTYKQCDRVIEQIKNHLWHKHGELAFEYQGSVPLNVHIKQHSDIDLLIVTGRFHSLVPPLTPVIPYLGDPIQDHIELRGDIVEIIKSRFPAVLVDNTGGKSVAIEGGSLNRRMDLVSSSWLYNSLSYNTSDLTNRGIKLYDQKAKQTIENYPFLHIHRCNDKDLLVKGKFKMLVRYIKNIIKDSQEIKISSYDAAGLIYNYQNSYLNSLNFDPVSLSVGCEEFLGALLSNPILIENAMVPNDTRKLFGHGHLDSKEVLKLYLAIKEINTALKENYKTMLFDDRNRFEHYFRKAS